MNQRLQLFIILIFFACNEKKPDLKQIKTQKNIKSVHYDSSEYEKKESFNGLNLIKSIVRLESQTESINSMKFFNKDSISDFIFIRDLFPRDEIDSIEFYGAYEKQSIHSKKIPENSLLIIYFNHKRLSRMRINLLEFEWNNNFIGAKSVFETGGIVFELDNQLCIYTINNCNERYKNIERIDSIIKTKLYHNSYDYERIITDCGNVSFKRKLN